MRKITKTIFCELYLSNPSAKLIVWKLLQKQNQKKINNNMKNV